MCCFVLNLSVQSLNQLVTYEKRGRDCYPISKNISVVLCETIIYSKTVNEIVMSSLRLRLKNERFQFQHAIFNSYLFLYFDITLTKRKCIRVFFSLLLNNVNAKIVHKLFF